MKKIFCVEDDENINELIEYTLNSMGFKAKGFLCASDFFDAIKSEIPQLIILDIMLPDKDGFQILSEIRKNHTTKSIPVIMLTAKTSQIDKIKFLDSGADDYITKPFDIMELVSRINAVLRRSMFHSDKIITYKQITVDSSSHKVVANDREIILTYKEFELLKTLIENHGIVLSRDKLMDEIWGTNFEGETRTVDVHIRTLRQKLGNYGDYIKTIRNVGYKID